MRAVIGIGRGNAREQVLKILAGQQIAVLQRLLAEIREQSVPAAVYLDRMALRRDGAALAALDSYPFDDEEPLFPA